MKPSAKYSQLRQSDNDILISLTPEAKKMQPKPRRDWVRKCLFVLLAILGTVFCLVLGYVAHSKIAQSTKPTQFTLPTTPKHQQLDAAALRRPVHGRRVQDKVKRMNIKE